mmetsp:Transcript_132385/g.295137  ORF Transcript_132385/g.295137 Transcript_132385/m.295137 type:complete len:489 (+) Transcript_132385:76-1542(+)
MRGAASVHPGGGALLASSSAAAYSDGLLLDLGEVCIQQELHEPNELREVRSHVRPTRDSGEDLPQLLGIEVPQGRDGVDHPEGLLEGDLVIAVNVSGEKEIPEVAHLLPREACGSDGLLFLLLLLTVSLVPELPHEAQEGGEVDSTRHAAHIFLLLLVIAVHLDACILPTPGHVPNHLRKLRPHLRVVRHGWVELLDEANQLVVADVTTTILVVLLEECLHLTHLLRRKAAIFSAASPGLLPEVGGDREKFEEIQRGRLTTEVVVHISSCLHQAKTLQCDPSLGSGHISLGSLAQHVLVGERLLRSCAISLHTHADQLSELWQSEIPRTGKVDLVDKVLLHFEALRTAQQAQHLPYTGHLQLATGRESLEDLCDELGLRGAEALTRAVDGQELPEPAQVQLLLVSAFSTQGLSSSLFHHLQVRDVAQGHQDVLELTRRDGLVLVGIVLRHRALHDTDLMLADFSHAHHELADIDRATAIDVDIFDDLS